MKCGAWESGRPPNQGYPKVEEEQPRLALADYYQCVKHLRLGPVRECPGAIPQTSGHHEVHPRMDDIHEHERGWMPNAHSTRPGLDVLISNLRMGDTAEYLQRETGVVDRIYWYDIL